MHLHPPRSHRSLRSRFSFGQKKFTWINNHTFSHHIYTNSTCLCAEIIITGENQYTRKKIYRPIYTTQHNKIVCLCLSVYYLIIFHVIFQNMHFTTFTSSARFPHSACSDHLRLRSMLVWFCVGSSNISFLSTYTH